MGSSKSLQLPATPNYYQNSNLGPNIDYGSKYNQGLLSGDFTGDRSWLSSLVNPNNSANALSYAQGLLAPQFRDNIRDITNQAVANNQNTSSTFTDSLAKASGDTNSAYQAILAQQAINDANQANANKLNILGQGENGLQGFTNLAQNETNAKNQFDLENYNNQVAAAIANKGSGSNIFGGLGTALGAGAGFLIGGPMGAGLGATIGGGIGGSIDSYGGGTGSLGYAGMGGGMGLMGSQMSGLNPSTFQKTGAAAPIPGFYAANASSSNRYMNSSPLSPGYNGLNWQ